MVYESRLELARTMLADFDPCVTGIAAQPFLLAGTDGILIRRAVPRVPGSRWAARIRAIRGLFSPR